MSDHDCDYAKLLGRQAEWQAADGEPIVCKWCHVPKNPAPKALDKTRKA